MKKIKLFAGISTLVMALFLSACETMDTYPEPQPAIAKFSVDILSDPSGAIIEINDNYVGKTPITVELDGWEATRTFARRHTIVAHPVQAGGQTQIKSFIGWNEPSQTYGDTIPENIYFNMSLIRIPEKFDIRIDK